MRTLFVFGSNKGGRHLGGAARYAAERYGAEHGVGEGETGDCYALPTMNADFVPLTLAEVGDAVDRFLRFASEHPELHFYVTRVGCGIAGFVDAEIGPMFRGAPKNCTFSPEWSVFGLPAWKEAM